MKIAFLGNFGPSHSTECHLALSMEELGHEVVRIQEGETRAVDVPGLVEGCDLFAWTQTYSLAEQGGTRAERAQMLDAIKALGIPTIAVHLDRYWGLEREQQITDEPWWHSDIVFSAEGGAEELFRAAGVNHRWFQPGVLAAECVPGRTRQQFAAPVCFVGSYSYHPAWSYRPELIQWLRVTYGRQFRLWPRAGRAIRGQLLNDLYASTTVVVGDSCLAPMPDGSPVTNYISDRVPETLGRGGFLIHPHVDGIFSEHYQDGVHLRTYELGDFGHLKALIDYYLAHPEKAREIAESGQAHVREHHTYTVRMAEVLAEVTAMKAAA